MHIETVPQKTQAIMTILSKTTLLQNFYLSGGTALSLYLGHRESEDLDFFTKDRFRADQLQEKLSTYGKLSDVMLEEGTLNCFMDKVKLQFLHYPYQLLEKSVLWNGICLSSVVDIACTKIMTVSMRGSKKDFIDIYFLLQSMTLNELLLKMQKKYHDINYNYPHIIKSLIYFEDADLQPMPRMHQEVTWDEVKQFLITEVKKISF